MRYGVCTAVANASVLKAQGWDYVEESVQGLLHAHDQSAGEWSGASQASASELPVWAANMMVPASHKVTGPDVDAGKLAKYMSVMLSRAQRVGIKKVVFGSGGARMVPDGWDKGRAREQIVSFLKSAAPVAGDLGVLLVVEHLNKLECNILTGLEECGDIVRAVGHPSVQLLFDTYHFWMDKLPMDELRRSAKLIRHVHVADVEERVYPGASGAGKGSDYGAVFKVLKEAGYDGGISVEALNFDLGKDGGKALAFLKDAWAKA